MKRIFLLAASAFLALAGDLSAATLNGKVMFLTKRGQKPVVNETLVWLEPLDAKAPKRPAGAFQMATRSKTFVPHVVAVPAGSTIAFPNEDPISHNLFSLSPGNTFDLGLYRKGAGKTEKFETPGVVNIYCNVHPNMSAVVHVMPTPYYGFTDANGNYSFDVPAGRYRVVAWNEQSGQTSSDVEIAASGVKGSTLLTLDSRNFRAQQHSNKEGKPYQKPSTKDY
ncbi:MAG TPA: hypothetical protein VFN10_07435 [Thermoanaerobaculia bacterium]|nr:hypothetical protein [Thermoanaerobaculia bacterium]